MACARYHPGLFKSRYPTLRGRDWILRVEADDFQAFVQIGLEYADHGRAGGRARAQGAMRDERGRFVKVEELPNV